MKNGEKYSRKKFLKTIFLGAAMLPILQYCKKKTKSFLLKITGTNHVLGHLLWAKDFPKPSEITKTKFLIVGSGITGLSAGRFFKKNNIKDFIIIELEDFIGGNSSNGENKFSKFPYGAHYLPLPNKEDDELIKFLRECKLYLGDDEQGEPILDDYQLSFPQDERLFYKNFWQNDLVPQKGVSEDTKKQFQRFFSLMKDFRLRKDAQNNYWFDIPVRKSSSESHFLESITFAAWLRENKFSAEELLWYLDYSCRDDYGLGIQYVSAWAGIHYFAGRKNNWATSRSDQVFTWPEGNARLAKHLAEFSEGKIITKHLVFDAKIKENVEVLLYDAQHKKTKKIIAEKLLLATPQFVNNHILKDRTVNNFNYVPWLLATLTLKNEFGGNEELAWDNVIFGSDGLGYIYDQHQNINQNVNEKVITYYRSFSTKDSQKTRKWLYRQGEEELKKLVLNDLKIAHPLIEDFILAIEFRKIGHAMISPVPNQIFGKNTEKARQNMQNKIFFAHSDLAGISIFEEAFHQGIDQAKNMINR